MLKPNFKKADGLGIHLSLYSHSIIKIILTHDHLGMNFTFVLVTLKTLKPVIMLCMSISYSLSQELET